VPSLLLMASHDGLPWRLNVKRSPSASAAVGLNVYDWPTVAPVDGVPEIVGALFTGSVTGGATATGVALAIGCTTVMANAGRTAQFLPSVTRIWMLRYVPTLRRPGVPLSVPVDLLKFAHPGWLLIRNSRRLPSGSAAEGRNE
jgi:hypothetical protein